MCFCSDLKMSYVQSFGKQRRLEILKRILQILSHHKNEMKLRGTLGDERSSTILGENKIKNSHKYFLLLEKNHFK